MKRLIALALAPVVLGLVAGVALARNEHCAGGIQYVSQALNDKNKGNLDDYKREINKAVAQLQQCQNDDPNDLEALGYLGWAYAEVDSARLAGIAFEKAIAGLKAKGDVKKVDWAMTNRESYWATAFNDGIAKINSAQNAYDPYTKPAETDADKTLKAEAEKNYQAALTSLTRASLLKPGEPKTMRNLGLVYRLMGDFRKAEAIFAEGLKAAPGDSALLLSIKDARLSYANQLVDEKKYDEAVAFFTDLQKGDPQNPDLWLGIADATFKRAQSKQGDARKPDFKAAGDAYAAAARLKPGDVDLRFNAALAYQNASEPKLADPLWREVIKARPDDAEAISALGSCLSDLGQYKDAIQVLWDGLQREPKNKALHRQLGAVYNKAGNSGKSTEELMVFLALQNGTPAADPAAAAKTGKAGTPRAQTLSSAGTPEEVVPWEIQSEKVESWFYWTKKQAFHFKGDALYAKSDWSAPDLKVAPAGQGAAKKP